MPFYFNGSTLSLTILTVSKIYLMMRIKGDVSFQRQDISTQHSIPRNDRLQKARKNIPFWTRFKRNRHGELRVTLIFRLKVALNLVSHYFVFYVLLLGMFKHIQYMQSSSLILYLFKTVADHLRAKNKVMTLIYLIPDCK